MYKDAILLWCNNIMKSLKKPKVRNIIIAVFVVLTYSLITSEYNIYLILNSIITISMITVFIYVNLIRTKFVDKTFMKSFQIGYFILIGIIILNIVGFMLLFEYTPRIYFILLFNVQAILECCALENFLKFKGSTTKSAVILIFYSIWFVVLFYIFKSNTYFYQRSEAYFLIRTIIISILISIVMCISVSRKVIKNKEIFLLDEFKQITVYISSIMLYYIGLIAIILGYKRFSEIIIFIKCIIFYRFYNFIIGKVLDNSLFKINTNIDMATKTKKQLNAILITRNRILNENNIVLKKSQEKNNQLIDSIYGGVFLFFNERLQYFNKKTLETLKIKNDEIIGLYLSDFIYKYFDITLKDVEKAGNYIPFAKMKYTGLEVEIFLSYVDENSIILYIHDISAINENKEIKKILEEYLEEEEIKKEFFANISHELKTPINLIYTALQMNQIYLGENNVEGIEKNRRIIRQNCLRLIRTINNFIDANKISEGYMIPEFKIHNIVEVVENASLASNKYIQLIENSLTFDANQEEIYVNCDKEMITRIILNILSNSVKYGKKDGNIKVSVGIFKFEYVMIKIQNDGLEIDRETIPYIFDKFTKLNKAFNRLKEGSGLGLFLTKALVELQGGTIRLRSNNKGNEFIITLPRITKLENKEMVHEEWETNQLEEKIDIEFSDIYIE
ncbi:HAMP domain-containing sensor histidine kinase [Clostridium sp. C2-6-12]|uniref:sensor histidine kinase n=1 Tax=Clostridium sp. C2-6-12 TaxID=2698832 RepID=UPI00137202C8|nr:HAMP domain-containing sensor histidine kinase [Clostridium sp. C2-6-12]